MKNRTRKLETLVNIAIIAVAVAICAVLFKQYFNTSPAQRAHGPSVGSKVSLAGVDLSSEGTTLLLVLQKGCHFCAESGPFYQRLAREAATRGGRVKLVAVLPQDPEEGRRYLSDLGVPIESVTQASLSSLDVTGTPTLILISGGAVSNVWVGKLPADEENDVLSKL